MFNVVLICMMMPHLCIYVNSKLDLDKKKIIIYSELFLQLYVQFHNVLRRIHILITAHKKLLLKRKEMIHFFLFDIQERQYIDVSVIH